MSYFVRFWPNDISPNDGGTAPVTLGPFDTAELRDQRRDERLEHCLPNELARCDSFEVTYQWGTRVRDSEACTWSNEEQARQAVSLLPGAYLVRREVSEWMQVI